MLFTQLFLEFQTYFLYLAEKFNPQCLDGNLNIYETEIFKPHTVK